MNQNLLEILAIAGGIGIGCLIVWAAWKVVDFVDTINSRHETHKLQQFNQDRSMESIERRLRDLDERMSQAMTIKDWHVLQEAKLRDEALVKAMKGKKK